MKIATVAQKPLGWQITLGAAACAILALAASALWIRLGVTEILFLLAPWIVVPVAVRLVPPVGTGLALLFVFLSVTYLGVLVRHWLA